MVNIINCGILDFNNKTFDKKIVCFGAGIVFDYFCGRYAAFTNYDFLEKIECIIDNNENLSGTFKHLRDKSIPIMSLQHFLDVELKNNYVLLITNVDYLEEIVNQLDRETALEGIECYVSLLLDNYRGKPEKLELTKRGHSKIPKKIHYCWFGGAPIPEHLQNFMRSWNQFCPDYEIIKWDESNYDITKSLYMKQAYEAKKWGFVPDYARLDIIYNHGGIYLDTDVEVLKSFDDLLHDDMFCGFETNSSSNFGQGFGATKGHPLIKDMAEQYMELRFTNQDGSLNLTASPVYQSMDLEKYGFQLDGKHQSVDGVVVYPIEILCPKSFYGIGDYFTENTHSIHHFDASWVGTDKLKGRLEKGRKLEALIEKRCR